MRYSNLSTRLSRSPELNPELLRRIEECRRRSQLARTHAEKLALLGAMFQSPARPLP